MFDEVYDLNNLYDAFRLSQKESYWKCSCQQYEYNLLRNIINTKDRLKAGTYEQKPFYEFDIQERGRKRHIKSLHISDRVVQRSFSDNTLVPAVTPYLIYDNGASLKNKGVSFARKRISIHLQKYYKQYGRDGYVLQIDFKKFFDSIPHSQLKDEFSSLLDEKEKILFDKLIDSFGGDIGLGIGSQISQVCGIYYPTPIDTYFKVVKSCKFYGRYMDDTYIIHPDKNFLEELLDEYKGLVSALGLNLSAKKTHITKLSHGFTFLKIKYNILENGRILKRLSRDMITRERRKLKKYYKLWNKKRLSLRMIDQAYKSWRGTYKYFDSHKSIREMDKLYNNLFGGIYYEDEI